MKLASKYTFVKSKPRKEEAKEESHAEKEEDEEEEFEINDYDDMWAQTESKTTTTSTDEKEKERERESLEEKKKKKIRFRKADTNVLAVDFGNLIEQAQLATGDPVYCQKCKALFSSVSELKPLSPSDGKDEKMDVEAHLWQCEFCGQENTVQLFVEEIPKSETVDYVIAPPPSGVHSTEDDNSVIFCIDISGSMGVSYEVEGKIKLKGEEKIQKLSSLNSERTNTGRLADQWLPNERRDITYVTRLQCVQAAIDSQFERLLKESPNKKVGIVTFNNEVTLFGDGTTHPTVITGDKLNSYDKLFEIGGTCSSMKSIQQTKTELSKKLFSLEETGSTALGPALVASLGMCASKRGSKIVICTDGLSNVGLGALDELYTEQDKDNVAQFYEQIALYARTQGISISVISIKGSDCSIENLGKLTELTSGVVERVDPLSIMKDFQSILSLPVIATHVAAKLLLHQGLFIRSEETQNSTESKDIGNVTNETKVTFEYGVRSDYKKDEFNKLKFLPFQIQITYTKLDGMKCMRCITKKQEITFDQHAAEEEANLEVLGINAVQSCARMASKGDYVHARAYNVSNKIMLERAAKTEDKKSVFNKWVSKGRDLEEELSTVQHTELSSGLDLDDEDDESPDRKKDKKKEEKRAKSRQHNRSDTTANMLYKLKNLNNL